MPCLCFFIRHASLSHSWSPGWSFLPSVLSCHLRQLQSASHAQDPQASGRPQSHGWEMSMSSPGRLSSILALLEDHFNLAWRDNPPFSPQREDQKNTGMLLYLRIPHKASSSFFLCSWRSLMELMELTKNWFLHLSINPAEMCLALVFITQGICHTS